MDFSPCIITQTPLEKGLRLLKQQVLPLKHAYHTETVNNRLNSIIPFALHKFIQNPNILVKVFDKKLGLIVLDKSWYINEGLR